jgi:hypothetical protein
MEKCKLPLRNKWLEGLKPVILGYRMIAVCFGKDTPCRDIKIRPEIIQITEFYFV